MLISGVYIKGNDLAGILNGKIKALLETSMINWSALLVLYHDKVKLTSPCHLPGNPSTAPGPLRTPGRPARGQSLDLQPETGLCIIFQGFRDHHFTSSKILWAKPLENGGRESLGMCAL